MASITADCFLSMQATTYVDYNQNTVTNADGYVVDSVAGIAIVSGVIVDNALHFCVCLISDFLVPKSC